jgi:TPR repeat protein
MKHKILALALGLGLAGGVVAADSQNESPEQAVVSTARLAAQGNAKDLSALATRYERAEGVAHDRVLAHAFNLLASQRLPKNDELRQTLERNAAEMSPEQQAEATSIAAAWKVGTPLPTTSKTGRLDPRDWYKAAAEKGDVQAAYKAGTLYWKFGYGLKPQPEQAAFWLRKAAQGGVADAQYQLSQLYTMGYGVPKDYVLASVLYRLAVKGGSKEAQAKLDAWDEVLTEQQLTEGNALLASWKQGDALPEASRYGMQRKINYVEDAIGKLAPTPEVQALFKAANDGDEAEFTRLLAKVDNIDDYLVDGRKLLHSLLLPADGLRAEADAWSKAYKNPRDTAYWKAQQASHAALLPAKTRMLALALQRGASVNEGTHGDNAAPLHLAAMFGTPEMVKMLLKHGADPRQYGGQNHQLAPLEFSLEQKEYARGVAELITPEQRTANILALLDAGAARPYVLADQAERRKKESQEKLKRPIADYLLWPHVLSQTRGTVVLDALLKTGTSPADEEDGKSAYGYAAEAGNVDAIAWLKPRIARYGKKHRDRWLDAAMLAMNSNAPGRDQVLQQLLVQDMDWSQQGPQQDDYSRTYRTLYGGSERIDRGTLMEHVTHARRAEWLPKLAALGAPANTGGSGADLVKAAQQNDLEGVTFLLAQAADPLYNSGEAVSQALMAPDGDADAILDLLLDQIVRVQKKSLVDIGDGALRTALMRPEGINAVRVRKLFDAGASLRTLDRRAIDAVFAAPDHSLASMLIKRSPLEKPSEAQFLPFAIRAGRVDLLPEILAKGEDPNWRGTLSRDSVQPNAVEYAISRGELASLKVLLAHGGVIDTSTVLPWGTALDRAVFSLNVDMLRLVSKDFSLPLKPVCMRSPAQLAKVVLNAPADYWKLLRQHGFATDSACAGTQQRLVTYLAEAQDEVLLGWVGQYLVERLPQLGPGRDTFDADTWKAIAASRNAALPDLLAKAGWQLPVKKVASNKPAPQKSKAADQTLQAKVVGHYYLTREHEMGAEILLHANGKFQYSMSYGTVDQYAEGRWKVWNQQVVFHTDTDPKQAALMRPATDAPAVKLAPGQVLVDLRELGESVPDFNVVLLGDAPLKAEGRTGAQGWRTAFSGPVRQIVVSHRVVNQNKWMVYAVPAADARRGSYQLDFTPPSAAQPTFNYTLDVSEGNLVLDNRGRELIFEKH